MKKTFTLFSIAIAFFICKPVLLKAQINVQDSLALVALYNSTNGQHWLDKYNWLTSAPVATWYGIIVDNERVINLELPYNNLSGTLPPEIGNLTDLVQLNLSGDLLSSLPAEIGKLTNLTALYLYNNQLSSLPPEIGNLTNLIGMGLDYNKLSSLPTEIGKLKKLENFSLTGNQLSSLPPGIGGLISLRNLILDNNLLSSLPSEIGNLKRLNNLTIVKNKLRSLPAEIGKLKNLSYLTLDDNQLTSLPSETGNLIDLRQLNVHDNQLSSLPPEIGNLIRLGKLYLDGNQLSDLPVEISNLANLQILSISNNRLSGSLLKEMGNLRRLRVLDLSYNQLTGIIPLEFNKLLNLTDFNVSHNQLAGDIPRGPGEGKGRLSSVNLSYNHFSGHIPQTLINLRYAKVYIDNNNLTFAGLESVVSGNQFSSFTYAPQANIQLHNNGSVFSVSAGGALSNNTYKWYKNGNLITTIMGDSTFMPKASGVYNVTITNTVAKALILYSDSLNYTVKNIIASGGIDNVSIDNLGVKISVYPNPATANTTLLFNASGKYNITITSLTGKVLQTKTGIAVKGQNMVQVNVNSYAAGIYLITVTDEKDKKQTVKLNKE